MFILGLSSKNDSHVRFFLSLSFFNALSTANNSPSKFAFRFRPLQPSLKKIDEISDVHIISLLKMNNKRTRVLTNSLDR